MSDETKQTNGWIRGGGGGGGKGGGGGARAAVEAPDSLRSKQFAKLIDLISEGEIEGLVGANDTEKMKSIFLNETPLLSNDGTYNFKDVYVQYRNGTQSQTPFDGFPATEFENYVGVEVKTTTPLVHTLSNQSCDSVRVTISVPQLSEQNSTNGDINGSSVRFQILLQNNGGGYAVKVDDTISGKTSSKYQRAYLIQLPGPGPWELKVIRITADATTSNIQNKTYWESYTGIIGYRLRYPNSAMVAMQVDAEQFRSIPSRAFKMKGMRVKVPTNYDPIARTYSGLWNGTFKIAWTDNPAWCFYDLLTAERYGLGKFVTESMVDKWGLYNVAQYCDQLVPDGFGGTEPRFTCNLYLQTREDAYKVINNFASIFRAVTYWSAGTICTVQDKPGDAVSLFTNANVIDGRFTYSGSSLKTRHSVALISWNDPSDFYRQKVEYVEDIDAIKKFGVVTTDIVAFGCTSRGQANRVGKWLLYSEQWETETVVFKTGLEGFHLYPGAIFKTSDFNRSGKRFGGRIVSATTTVLTLDANVDTTSPAQYTMNVMLPDGTVAASGVQNVGTTGNVIQLQTALAQVPQADAVWVLIASNLQAEVWRLVGVTEPERGIVEVTAISHRSDKFAAVETGLKLEPIPISNIKSTPDAVTALTVTESLYQASGSTVGIKATISWTSNASRFIVKWREVNGTWNQKESPATSIDIDNLRQTTYEFSVLAVSALGNQSKAASLSQQILGFSVPPSDVTGFVSLLESYTIKLSWNKGTDLDLDGYEIREGATWNAGTVIGQYKTTSITVPPRQAGTYKFWIKAVDTTGNYSTNAVSRDVTITGPEASNLTAAFVGENIVLKWTAAAGAFAIDRYQVRKGSTWSTAEVVAEPKSSAYTLKAQFGGAMKFWVAAIDAGGTIGAAASTDVTVNMPSIVSVTNEVIDNNVLLRWSDATTTLPVVRYKVYKGTSFAIASLVGDNGDGRFAAFFEQAAGTYTYWIQAEDSAGNLNQASSVAAIVSQPPDYVLRSDINTDFTTGTIVNGARDGANLYMPIAQETWTQHFANRSWTTIQDQINAGYPIFIQPSTTTGSYEEVIDYGAPLPATTISTTLTYENLVGTTTITPTLAVKLNAGDAWTTYPGVAQVVATNFRYVKVRYDFSTTDNHNVLWIKNLNIRMSLKLKSDSGTGYAIASDATGTTVNFTAGVNFIDVTGSPLVQPMLGTPTFPVVDFTDTPYPTTFKVLLYDRNGNRVSGAFSWQARGV